MKKIKKFIINNIKTIIITVLVGGLFIFTSWLSRQYADELSNSAFSNIYGELIYFVFSILAVMIAGLTSSPLIPLALTIWGATVTIILTTLGWTIGSLLAFWLSRKYGEVLVCRLINKCDFDEYRNKIKTKGLFWQVLLARIFLPVDVISYVLGMFTKMKWYYFLLATMIGSSIFTTLAILASSLSITVQIILGIVVIFLFFMRLQKYIRSLFIKEK